MMKKYIMIASLLTASCGQITQAGIILTREILQQYKPTLLGQIEQIKKGLNWKIHTDVGRNTLSYMPSWIAGDITEQELNMFPMFGNLDKKKVINEYQTWLDTIKDTEINRINSWLNEGQKKQCRRPDDFNRDVLHRYTVKNVLKEDKQLTICEVNDKIKELPDPEYKELVFERTTADLLYRNLVIPNIKST